MDTSGGLRRPRWFRYFAPAFILLWSALAFAWSCKQGATIRSLPPPREVSSFEVRVEGQCVYVRNTSSESLGDGSIDFTAELDNSQYIGSKTFSGWEPGTEIEIVIAPPRDPGRLKHIQFTGQSLTRASPNARFSFTSFKFSTTLDPPVRIEFQHPSPWSGGA